ncbi:MAG: GNAT family N-acetyltransferase [Oscillospiraceae bacterium]|nr:GNAT family N-acetyltransferase [Oscillospiraceae bacterium]
MEQVNVVCLNEKISDDFYALAAEYLPGSSQSKMRERAEMYPKAFTALVSGGEVIGVCFGWARKHDAPSDSTFTLDGIAVKVPFQKKGYGKILLSAFERAAAEYGFDTVSVGSAGGYVEKFYIDCGFVPKEYKVWSGGAPSVEKTFDSIEDYYAYQRKDPDGFVVMEKRIGEKKAI